MDKPSTTSGIHPIIEKYNYATGYGGYIIRQAGNQVWFDVLQGTADHTVTANTILQAGNWYYVVGTYDGNYLSIYVNGQLAGQAAWTGTD